MSSIESKLRAFEKTERFKKLVAKKIKVDPNFGAASKGHGSKDVAIQYGKAMKKILQDEILPIKSSYSKKSFLDYIIISEEFVNGSGWVVNVSFDEEKMHRESLYPEKYHDGVQLDEIFNEGYSARAYAYGVNQYGDAIYSKKQRDALYFVQRAVDNFNTKYKGKAIAEYNRKYSGGTL